MIGLLDSGMGGENTVRALRKMIPDADLALLKDTKNAPYGTKTKDELIPIVSEALKMLFDLGSSEVLIACCTASSIWSELPRELRERSHPIIEAVAKKTKDVTKTGRVAVIATEGTVRSHAFRNALSPLFVKEIAFGELVNIVERGISDANATDQVRDKIKNTLEKIAPLECDTLVLGCTHFPSLLETVEKESRKFGIKYIVSSVEEGAGIVLGFDKSLLSGRGATVRIKTG